MLRRLACIGIAALALAACGNKSSGPVVAKGDGFTITADDFKARLDEQSPFLRARFSTIEKKKEFLDNLVRMEVLAREAEKQGFRNDPEVQRTLRTIMVQKMIQKSFSSDPGSADVPDADVQKFYDEHPADYHRPKRLRAALVAFNAAAGAPDRAKKLALAKKTLAALQAAEKDKKDPAAFAKAVTALSEDAATKGMGGDIGLKTQEEVEKTYPKELSAALFAAAKAGDLVGVVEAPQALYIAKVTMVQDEVNRTLDQVKPQIVARLAREKRSKEFDEWVKKLRDQAKVTIDEQALAAIEVPAAPPGAPPGPVPGMGPHDHSHMMMAAPGPAAAPAAPPAPAPASK